MQDPIQGWNPTKKQVAEFEALLKAKRLKEVPLRDRVRVYSGVVEGGKRYIIAALLTPNWYGGAYDPKQRDPLLAESWNTGSYVVPVSRFPSRVSIVPDRGCGRIRVNFDVSSKSISENSCME